MVEEEHGILTYNDQMFSVPHFDFQLKSFNISTILALWRLDYWLSLEVYFLNGI